VSHCFTRIQHPDLAHTCIYQNFNQPSRLQWRVCKQRAQVCVEVAVTEMSLSCQHLQIRNIDSVMIAENNGILTHSRQRPANMHWRHAQKISSTTIGVALLLWVGGITQVMATPCICF